MKKASYSNNPSHRLYFRLNFCPCTIGWSFDPGVALKLFPHMGQAVQNISISIPAVYTKEKGKRGDRYAGDHSQANNPRYICEDA